MIRDQNILCLSTIRWNFLWQRHQIFMSMLAANGNKIYFVETLNPTLPLSFSSIPKILRWLARLLSQKLRSGPNTKPAQVTVVMALVVPGKGRMSQAINRMIFLPLFMAALTLKGITKPVIWTYLPTASALFLIRALKPSLVIYDCVFDVALHPDYPRNSAQAEETIIRRADIIFTDNHYLYNRIASRNKNVHLIPAGVDFTHFAPQKQPEPPELAMIPKPRICFFGGIDGTRVDLKLIASIAHAQRQWTFVLLGPVLVTDTSLPKAPNIFWGGVIAHTRLPAYLQAMDVLLLPYKIIPFSKSIFPAKLFECLACGKPIVATPLDEITRMPQGLFEIGRTHEEFVQAIGRSLSSDTEEKKARRIAHAQENSWQTRFAKISGIINRYSTP